jgi:hypothetical protein
VQDDARQGIPRDPKIPDLRVREVEPVDISAEQPDAIRGGKGLGIGAES